MIKDEPVNTPRLSLVNDDNFEVELLGFQSSILTTTFWIHKPTFLLLTILLRALVNV